MGWVNVGAAAVSLYSANKKAKDQKKAADRAQMVTMRRWVLVQ